jgi:hypothetical protein
MGRTTVLSKLLVKSLKFVEDRIGEPESFKEWPCLFRA